MTTTPETKNKYNYIQKCKVQFSKAPPQSG